MDSIKWHVRSGIYGVEWRTKVGISCQRVKMVCTLFTFPMPFPLNPLLFLMEVIETYVDRYSCILVEFAIGKRQVPREKTMLRRQKGEVLV